MVELEDHEGPRGAPPKKNLADAYRELLENLFFANQVFEEREDCGRQGVVLACHAIVRFIAVNHENPLLVAPMIAMRSALLDLEKGIANPIIDKLPTGRRSRSAFKKHAGIVAAACLDALVELGIPVEEAASKIARFVGQWRGMGDQPVTAHTVKNWRNSCRGLSLEQRRGFDLMRNDILGRDAPREMIETLLRDGPPGFPKT